MKIVIIGTAYPYRGGLATFNERLARQFSEEGHDVHIETFTLQYPNFLFPGKTQYSESPAPTDLHIVRSVNSCNPFSWIRLGHKLRREKPDLVIMDITMPNKTGIEALADIKKMNPAAKVVMCSAMGQEAMVVEAIKLGALDFIVKPFKPDRIIATVTKILG